MSTKMELMTRSLAIAGGLTLLKVLVYGLTHSMSILASAADSFMDFLVSAINMGFVVSAAKPADKEHPYGHGKIESLAGLLQSSFMAAVAVGIATMAVKRFNNPMPIEEPLIGILITILALALSLWHVRNLRNSMIATGSQVMAAEYLHYASDILAYLGVLLSFILFKFTSSVLWDIVISLLIVAYLFKTVAGIFSDSLGELLDKQLPDDTLREIKSIILAYHPQIVGYHDLRTRKVGQTKFIEFHVVLRKVERFDEAHDITEGLINKLVKKYPGSIVTVHTDPEEAMEEPHPTP